MPNHGLFRFYIGLVLFVGADRWGRQPAVYDLQQYGVTKSALLLSIQNNTHLRPDVISEESDGSRGGEVATFTEKDVVEDSEVEETTEESEVESSDKEEDAADNATRNSKAEKKGDLQSIDMEFYA